MNYEARANLEQIGLSAAEARIYLALLKQRPMGASAIAKATRIPRTSVYPTLFSLVEKGLIEGGAGYGSRFSAVAPEHALPALVARETEALRQREDLAKELAEQLAALAEASEIGPEELVQVVRNSRVFAELYARLQLETEHRMDGFAKPPFFGHRGNPQQSTVMRRGVRVRAIYEHSVLDDQAFVKPYLTKWIAGGEEARVYEGVLPHKMVIFDSKVVLMPLIMPGEQTKSLLIRNQELAETFSLAFEHIWERSKPLSAPAKTKTKIAAVKPRRPATSGRNHQARRA